MLSDNNLRSFFEGVDWEKYSSGQGFQDFISRIEMLPEGASELILRLQQSLTHPVLPFKKHPERFLYNDRERGFIYL